MRFNLLVPAILVALAQALVTDRLSGLATEPKALPSTECVPARALQDGLTGCFGSSASALTYCRQKQQRDFALLRVAIAATKTRALSKCAHTIFGDGQPPS